MIRKIISLLLAVVFMTGCAASEQTVGKKRYQTTFLTLFDTVTTIVGYADTEEEFEKITGQIHEELEVYHQFFDIYNDYEGVHNIKTINDQAGIAPVKVNARIIDFLKDCKEYYELTNGRVNIAMGSVLRLWHEERENGIHDPEHAKLPKEEALQEAAKHCNMDTVVIDEKAGTVYLEDPEQSLDVGAVAKGWSTEQVCKNAPSGLLVSVGGNVRATGPKPGKNSPWTVGIQAPDGDAEDYLHTIYVDHESVVTSGDYQRYYMVDGKTYHHIIDPDTLYPAAKWRAVSIVCEDSGLADALSTALFMLPMEEGQKLLDQCDACAIWVGSEGEIYYSTGFKALIKT